MVGFFIGGGLLVALAIIVAIFVVWYRNKVKNTLGEAALRAGGLIAFTIVFLVGAGAAFIGGGVLIIKGIIAS